MSKSTIFGTSDITFRMAHTEAVELTVTANGKAQLGEINHLSDRLFEITRISVKLTALSEDVVCDPQPTVLDRLMKIGILDYGKNERISLASRAEANKACGIPLQRTSEATYEWLPSEPIQLIRGEGLAVEVVPREMFTIAMRGERRKIDAIRVEITAEGDLCVLQKRV